MKRTALLLSAAALALAAPARAAIDLGAIKPDGFTHGVVLTVDGYAAGKPALTNFPVLVRISEAGIPEFDYDDVLVSGGGDIRFADANGNALPFEIDTWTNDATSLVWVTLPEMTNGTEFAMFYGAAQSDADAFVATRHPWADYTGVWHLGDSGTGSGKTVSDSTTNKLTGTTASNSSKRLNDGAVGRARTICASVNSKNQEQISVSLSDPNKKAVVDALVPRFSVSLWYRIKESVETSIQWDYLIGRKPSEKANDSGGWAIQMADPASGSGTKYGIRVWSSETTDSAPPATAIPVIGKTLWTTVAWFKLDVVYDNGNYSLYLNGAIVDSGALKGNAVNGNSTILGIGGAAPTANVIRPFTGDMDEVRLRRGTVSADWVAADYATQTSASFLSAGTVETVAVSTRPTAEFEVLDTGAAFLQFSGRVTSLGEGAASCTLHYKCWKDSESEPAGWTSFATGVGSGATVSHFLVGLDTLTDYHVAFKASNDLATPEDSDVVTEAFTTSGVGDAGESGGASERQLDEFVHTFTITERGVSQFEFTPPTGVTAVEALVVAGGGAGGWCHGGGGGGGGLVHSDALAVVPGQTYTITVGAGGVASESAGAYGGNGGGSSIASNGVVLVSATGGGAGGNGGSNTAGQTGGSGGGSSANEAGGAGTTGQGFAGAKGNGSQAGGGGGAKAVGSEPVTGGTGAVSSGGGGSGLSFEISGATVFYAGGGGGGGDLSVYSKTYGTAGTGGLGGGGNGGQEGETEAEAAAEDGTDGLGGGGGGGGALSGYEKGGDGGNGVVIIRYGAGGDGVGVVHPTVSLTGLSYDDASGDATATYRVGWAGDGYDRADVFAIWGYDEDKLVYTNAVSTAPAIGQGTGSFALPRMSRTVYVRLLATNSGNYTGVSPEVKSLVLFNPNAPIATISAPEVLCTNATFAVAVTDLGGAATGAAAELQLCDDRFFDPGTYSTLPFDGALSATGTLHRTVVGLATNRTYWARAVVTNDLLQDFTTDPIAVTTVAPGAPVPEGAVVAVGFSTLGVDARLDDWGAGSRAATMFVEASTDPDFGTIAARSETRSIAETNAYERFGLAGLQGGETEYYLRVGATNEWGIGAFADIPPAATRATPVASSGIAYFFEVVDGTNTLSVVFGVTEVFDGAPCAATLYYGPSATSSPRISSKPITGPGALRWDGLEAADKPMYAIVVVSASAGGRLCTQRWSVRILPGAQTYPIADFDEFRAHASSANALVLRPGDTAVLPETNGRQAYRVLNGRFAALAGTTLVALEPGICGVEFLEDGTVDSTMAVLVLPEPIRGGGLFVFDEGAIPAAPADPYVDWDSAASWRKIGSATNDWPNAPNDTAVIPLYEHEAPALIIRNADSVTVGAIYFGGYRDAHADLTVAGKNNSNRRGFAFDRTDGKPALLQVCGNTTGVGEDWNRRARFKFGNRISELRFLVDTRIDGGWPGDAPHASQGRVTFDSQTNRVEAGATVSLHSFDTQSQRQSRTIEFPNLAGSGTVWNRSAAMVRVSDDAGRFSGVLRDSGGFGAGNDSCTGPMFVRTATTTNCTGETVGWVGRKGADPATDFALGVGCFQTGWTSPDAAPAAHDPWFPKKGFSMHGGLLRLQGEWTAWSGGDPRGAVRDPDVLEIDGGFDYLCGSGTLSIYPTVWFEAGELRHPGTASLLIRDESVMGERPATNQVTILHGVSDFAIGPAGDPASPWSYPIVPWIAQPVTDSYTYLMFGCFDGNDRLVRPPFYYNASGDDHRDERVSLRDWPDGVNVCCRFGSIRIAEDKTFNSLYLQNEWVGDYNKLLGVGRTLTIASGGLILAESKWTDGVTRFGAENGGATNGTLRLGDETHPAYVWAHGAEKFSDDEKHLEGPCQIWADVVAPGGLVACYTGALLLGGNQTNIENEIVVNAGTLVLGTTNTPCRLRPELPVRVHANAKLAVPNAGSLTGTILQLDGAAGWFGTIEIPAGVEATCKKLYRRDYPEKPEWESLPRGVYTGDEATATALGCFYEPDLFSGAGTLSVYRDDIAMPTILILR